MTKVFAVYEELRCSARASGRAEKAHDDELDDCSSHQGGEDGRKEQGNCEGR